MNCRIWMSMAVVCLFVALAMKTAQADDHRIITFDAPHSGTSAGQGTQPLVINWFGTITGNITDSNYGTHGFVRTRDGEFTEFDAPGADPIVGCTCPVSISDLGVITGFDIDTNGGRHGFLRTPDGNITTFDTPWTGTGAAAFTNPRAISLDGTIVGGYLDTNAAFHAFRRSPDGTFINFVAPGECTTNVPAGCHGTGAWDINLFGTIVGAYEDTSGNFVAHTYIRSPDGKFKTFSVPGSSQQAGQGTLPATASGLNVEGAITGLYYDANNAFHGFLRKPNGTFIKFEAPGADTTTPFNGTFPASLNDFGAIAGYDLDINEVYHGFERSPEGEFTTFDAPGADMNPGDYNGTFPTSINLFGVITGYDVDASNVYHGFIRKP
jgi:uncharacterized membrane protein